MSEPEMAEKTEKTDQTASLMSRVRIRPSDEVAQRLTAPFGGHFARYVWDHFTGFGEEIVALGLCNRLGLLLADYRQSLPEVARRPWDMSLAAFQDELMPAIVSGPDATTATALWASINAGESL